MNKFARFFFSMRMMTVGLIIFLVAIAVATFLESQHDTQTAKIIVYNAKWFEILLGYLCLSLIANIFTYRMYQKEKMAMLVFHLSFIVMIIGAGITRYVSFEGIMPVREGEKSNLLYSADPYFWFVLADGETQTVPYSTKTYMSEITNNYFAVDVPDFPGHDTPIKIEYVDFRKKMIDSLVINDSIQGVALEIVTDGMSSNYVTEGDFLMLGEVALSFEKEDAMPGIEVSKEGAKYMIKSQLPMRYLPMAEMQKAARTGGVPDSLYRDIPMDTLVPFQMATLYQVGVQQFVFKSAVKNARKMLVSSGRRDVGSDYLTVKITDGDKERLVDLKGGMGVIPEHEMLTFNGLIYRMEYGSKRIELPFHIRCNDFQLDKYPGSMAPSSFASEVSIIDEEMDYTRDQRIFMNHVMDYRGYRFFQSGYDPDEGGTILSVNHDWWGTNISYLGYLLMGIGMILSLFAPVGRFRELNKLIKKSREKRKVATVLVALLLSSLSFAQEHNHEHHEGDGHNHNHAHEQETTTSAIQKDPVHRVMSEEHSEGVSTLLVQDLQGRIIPMHTLSDQLLRKISRSNKFGEFNAVQTIMSMHMYPDYWAVQDVIYVSSKSNLREKLGMESGLTSYAALTDSITGQFKLMADYTKAHQTLESKRGEYEKRLLKLGERYQVIQMVFSWNYMRLLPLQGDPNNTWYVPLSQDFVMKDSVSSRIALNYLSNLDKASKDGKYGEVNDLLEDLKKYQREVGKDVVPSESKVAMEVSYNKMNIFKNSSRVYGLIGFILLLVFFVKVLIKPTEKREKIFKWISRPQVWIAMIILVYHGYGLYMRSMITGYAPWSNGYEAMVFIAWIGVLVGLIASKKYKVILAGSLIFSYLLLFVTELNLMDPEITPMQPVLKSYWLMIHVAIITGSYAPLGISCILGLLNLVLHIVRNDNNKQRITPRINELTYVSEMIMTIGLIMLTIGTFLGGIWANESWGRYWGWDPKETWALVAILVYAVILHLRFIPALKSKFLFNAVSFWGYSSILFTFFGVNFILTGLHSYAQGDGLGEFPAWITYTVAVFAVFTAFAAYRNWAFKKGQKALHDNK